MARRAPTGQDGPLHPEAHQACRRPRAARQDRAGRLVRARARADGALPVVPGEVRARADRPGSLGRRRVEPAPSRPDPATQAPPDLLRPEAGRKGRQRGERGPVRRVLEARVLQGDPCRGRRRRAPRPRLLPVHLAPRAPAPGAGPRGRPPLLPRRLHGDKGAPGRDRPLPGLVGCSRVPSLAEGGGLGAQPHGRRHGGAFRPVVEPRGRGAGDGPRPPDRPGADRHELQARLPGHRRGEGPRPPGGEAGAPGRRLRSERRGLREALPRGPEGRSWSLARPRSAGRGASPQAPAPRRRPPSGPTSRARARA